MADFTIEELTIPRTLDEPGGADFVALTRLLGDNEAGIIGTRDRAYEPEEYLPVVHDPHHPYRLFLARADGRIVGVGHHEVQVGEEERSIWFGIDVHPDYRRRGIGSALYDTLAQVTAADGDTVVQMYAFSPADSADSAGERITSPTGFGSVATDDEATRFLLRRGYRLTQVNRLSRLGLPAAIDGIPAPDGYDLEAWTAFTPEHRLDDMAVLNARMSIDPPAGESDYQHEVWDADRVRADDERHARDGRQWMTVAVRHAASDTLVGFTQIVAPTDTSRPAHQLDTIVLEEHRGHRLGMLLKVANLRRLADESGAHPAIYTWNAEENRPMLDVNEAVGFVPLAYEGSWKAQL